MARRLTICGTAAAEAIPAIHCVCDTCRRAWELGGKDFRTRAAYQLGQDVRVDFGPDSHFHMRAMGQDYAHLQHLLITHSHQDHWLPEELSYRRPGFCVLPEGFPPLTVYGNDRVLEAARQRLGNLEAMRIELREIHSFQEVQVCPDLRLTTLKAEHAGEEDALNFLIEEPDRSLLVANDTGFWSEETWEFIAGRRVDVALIDGTCGRYDQNGGHMGAPWVAKFAARLGELGCLSDSPRLIVTHFSHNGHANHDQLVEIYTAYGIEVAYDGLVVG